MKIKLKKPYQLSNIGDVIDPNEPVAALLINRGIAEPVREKEKKEKKK